MNNKVKEKKAGKETKKAKKNKKNSSTNIEMPTYTVTFSKNTHTDTH
jgi:hypothetical protein